MDLIECTVRLYQQHGATEVVKAGVDAITPAEAVLLRMIHSNGGEADSDCVIGNAVVIGTVERSKKDELERLRGRYKASVVQAAFPALHLMPDSIKAIELPPSALGQPRKPDTDALRAAILAKGRTIPEGNLSAADLQALLDAADA